MSPFSTSADRSGFRDQASAPDSREAISAPAVSAALDLTVPAAHWWQRLRHRKQGGASVRGAPLRSRDA